MNSIAKLDQRFVWHPFTQMRDWLKREPIVLVEGQGAVVRDIRGREYLDANSSIWTNLHGHRHEKIDAALRAQLKHLAHSSALGLANAPASRLAQGLIKAANPNLDCGRTANPNERLGKVFFSDDGSTAMEVALKLAYEFTRRTRGSGKAISQRTGTLAAPKSITSLRRPPQNGPRFLSLEGAYHGDTIGAVSLGHIDLFHKSYANLLFPTDQAMAPYCYRCPYNRAKPERGDARTYRKCDWECLDKLENSFRAQKRKGNNYAAFVFEPLIQGAAGMIPQPEGWLERAAPIARNYGALLIADEVMTGFGRTGGSNPPWKYRAKKAKSAKDTVIPASPPLLFACHQEGVQPDLMAVAKGLTGGYLPMAATLTSQAIFDAFLGEYGEFRTFFHGHSFTANQLGAAAALASLDLLFSRSSIRSRGHLHQALQEELQTLWRYPSIGDIRQVGLIVGIELVRNWRTREPFDLRQQAGIRVCDRMARLGVLTRPIGNVIVLMPPYCTTPAQAKYMVSILGRAIEEEWHATGKRPRTQA